MPARYAAVNAADLLFGRATTVRIGYAARETVACRMGEQDCGPTVYPYHACCPGNTECGSPKLNAYCCELDKDCTAQLTKLPQCANPEHDMYDFGGFFCCEQGRKGYGNHKTDGDGCGAPDYKLQEFDEWLTIAVSGRAITTGASKTSTGAPSATNPGNTKSSSTTQTSGHASSTGASSSTTDPSASSPTAGSPTAPSDSSPSPSSTDAAAAKSNAGPIAGGVVGGILALALIAFLVWFLRRRKARSYASAAPASPSGAYQAVEGQGPEKDVPLKDLGTGAAAAKGDEGGVSELPGKERGDVAAAAELYSPGVATTAELHGVERGPGELPAWDGREEQQLRAGDRGGPVELP
ncbi:hypothetical protein VF21_01889 [Pseudogymnoascus sp. 05NY08]|nr:hypothetical protein VF21_01889 [Pseudogymnoascus sp. 05NY08]